MAAFRGWCPRRYLRVAEQGKNQAAGPRFCIECRSVRADASIRLGGACSTTRSVLDLATWVYGRPRSERQGGPRHAFTGDRLPSHRAL